MATPLPTPEQEQRAKWDLLLLDIEMRTEQLRSLKQLSPLDIELRTQQAIQMKRVGIWQSLATLAISAMTLGGALIGAILWIIHLWTKN